MGRLVKIHNGEVLVVPNMVATPTYTLHTADYAGGATPPQGWGYFADNGTGGEVVAEDFAPLWAQPLNSTDAYKLGDVVQHSGKRWSSNINGNVWEPGISSWTDTSTTIPSWVQPGGSTDAYAINATVNHNGSTWTSLTDANVWEPGVALWRKSGLIAPDGTVTIQEWIQPTGSGDAYPLGAIVAHNGHTWESLYASNVWEPGVFGWTQLT